MSVQDTSSTAVGYTMTIGGRQFEQTANDGLELLVFEDHVDMVDMLSVRIGGTESQPEWGFQIGDEVECFWAKGADHVSRRSDSHGTVISSGWQYEHHDSRDGQNAPTRPWSSDTFLGRNEGFGCGLGGRSRMWSLGECGRNRRNHALHFAAK